LGVIEQFLPGQNTYVEEPNIYSTQFGMAHLDTRALKVKVFPKRKAQIVPTIGDVGVGEIVHTSNQMTSIALTSINETPCVPSYTCLMHISRISRKYLDSMDDAVRRGDIIRVKIIDAKTLPLQAESTGVNFGVVYAECSECGGKLKKIGTDTLKCTSCESTENRKISIHYGSPMALS
jgi:exosome complex component CSL4